MELGLSPCAHPGRLPSLEHDDLLSNRAFEIIFVAILIIPTCLSPIAYVTILLHRNTRIVFFKTMNVAEHVVMLSVLCCTRLRGFNREPTTGRNVYFVMKKSSLDELKSTFEKLNSFPNSNFSAIAPKYPAAGVLFSQVKFAQVDKMLTSYLFFIFPHAINALSWRSDFFKLICGI